MTLNMLLTVFTEKTLIFLKMVAKIDTKMPEIIFLSRIALKTN